AHTAADSTTGALGDVEICLRSDDRIVTVYEMKSKGVTTVDIDGALKKIAASGHRIDNYIFITTDQIDPLVSEYAKSFYETTGGIEIAILDCIDFLRHFLHFFHRVRLQYIENYQALVMAEHDSAVSQALKEVFLTLRVAAESPK
ncbi:MAG: restriction endonuclease, SacI family, partial [Treponema sp.]|nr:restriction endonuclease, SacI family [Treponema sp.]